MKSVVYAALLISSLVVLSGCDQVESSGKQLLDTAANSAKQAIDDTHQAATKALEEARQDLSVMDPVQKPKADADKSAKEI